MSMNSVFDRSELVKYVWKDIALTKSDDKAQVVDLSKTVALEEALAHFSSDLSFVDRLKVLEAVKEKYEVEPFAYFKALDQYFDTNLHGKIWNLLFTWPKSFLGWSSNKNLNPKDFRVFLKDQGPELQELMKLVGELEPSKMSGLQIIDLSLDLLAQKKVSLEKIKSFKNEQILLNFLKKTRFSETIKNDQDVSVRLSKLNLSQDIKIKAVRVGDQNQMHLEIKSSTPEDLIKKTQKVQKKINEIQSAWLGDDR